MSANGRIFSDVVTRQNLIIDNSTDKCFGVITRYKKTVRGTEKKCHWLFCCVSGTISENYENVHWWRKAICTYKYLQGTIKSSWKWP